MIGASRPTALAAVAAIAVAGCGGEGDSGADLARFTPPGALVFVEAEARTTGGTEDDLRDFVLAGLESSVDEPLDYAEEVEPWLGERASISFGALEHGEPTDVVIAAETTDARAARELIESRAGRSASYEGVEFEVGGDGNGIGVIDNFLVLAEGEAGFEAAVDAARGDSLADEARFERTFSVAPEGSFADAYMDLGGLLDAPGGEIDPRAREALERTGLAGGATAVASAFPTAGQIRIEISADLEREEAPAGDASALIDSLPADSVAAVGTPGFGEELGKAIEELDASGVPGELPPKQLKGALRAAGVEVAEVSESFEDAAMFALGPGEATPRGALVLTGDSGGAARTVGDLGAFLRRSGAPGVSAVGSGGASGFSVRSPDLGPEPLFVVARGSRVAVGYELPLALRGLNGEGGETLSDVTAYRAAVASLGDTPLAAYADWPEALPLAESLISRSGAEDLREAGTLLGKIAYLAMGDTGGEGGLATAELIVGLER